VKSAVVRRWGEQVLNSNGAVDRKKLAAIVFADPNERKALERLVHPWIGRRLKEEVALAGARPQVRLIVIDAAVLLEAGWDGVCDRIVFVHADEGVRRQRVLQRGWRLDDLARREAAQMPLTEKRSRADHVLDNSSALEHLGRQVDDLMRLWGLEPASIP
jgi:dephospho-CoA kinase